MAIPALSELNNRFNTYSNQLVTEYGIKPERANIVLDSMDNGDLEITKDEYKKAKEACALFKRTTDQGGTEMAQFDACFKWSMADDSFVANEYVKTDVANVMSRRESFYDALVTLEEQGWHLKSTRQVTKKKENLAPIDDATACAWNAYYELTFSKDGTDTVRTVVVPLRYNLEMAYAGNDSAKELLKQFKLSL